MVCQAYVEGVPTRRVDDLVKAMGIEGIGFKMSVADLSPRLLPREVGPGAFQAWSALTVMTCDQHFYSQPSRCWASKSRLL